MGLARKDRCQVIGRQRHVEHLNIVDALDQKRDLLVVQSRIERIIRFRDRQYGFRGHHNLFRLLLRGYFRFPVLQVSGITLQNDGFHNRREIGQLCIVNRISLLIAGVVE